MTKVVVMSFVMLHNFISLGNDFCTEPHAILMTMKQVWTRRESLQFRIVIVIPWWPPRKRG